MKIGAVNIEGFMAVGSAALGLADRGLTLIQGINNDDDSATSNGAGKSTLPDAISWCLYGVTARGESGDDIINNSCKSAKVSVQLIDADGTSYKVTRHRKDKKGKNRVTVEKSPPGGTTADLTLGTDKETQLRINQIVGCDVDVFNAAIYQGQESIPDMPNMTDKQIKGLIEHAAGIDVLERCYRIAMARKTEANSVLTRAETSLEHAAAKLESVEAGSIEVGSRLKEWSKGNEERIKQAQALNDLSKSEHQESKRKLDSAELKVPQINAAVAKHETVLTEQTECNGILRGLRDAQAEQSTNLRLAQGDVDRLNMGISQFTNKLNQVSARVGTGCEECGKEILEEDMESVKTGISRQIDSKNKELLDAERKVMDERNSLEGCASRATEYEAEMPDYTETSQKLTKCKLILAKIETLRVETAGLMSAWKTAQRIKDETDAAVNPHAAAKEKNIEDLVLAKKGCDKEKKEHKRLDNRLKLMEKAAAVYSPAGVRAHILDHVTPFLNARTAHYLSAMSDGNMTAIWSTQSITKAGDVREKFKIDVENMSGGKKFGLLSGGEKRKVRLACAMALQDVVAGRAEKPIELFMADEIDDALDDAGLERLMGLLEEKARERGTVLVISHNSLSDWIREVTTVTKEGGVSTITGSLSA